MVSHLVEGVQVVLLGTSHIVGALTNSFCGWHEHLFRLTDFLSGGSWFINAVNSLDFVHLSKRR